MADNRTYQEIKELVAGDFKQMSEVISSVVGTIHEENKELAQDISRYLTGTSKQLRACLIFLFSRLLYGEPNQEVIKLAAAVEIIHNATLIHDDVIDNAPLRRGEITLHEKYSSNLAVISGDYLLALAINLLNSIEKKEVTANFTNCLISLCKGEVKQYFSLHTTPTINEYLQKSEAKTASLFVAALKSLCDINNSSSTEIETFARYFGTAFQIKDDLNNFINEKAQKPLYLDLKDGIYTAPVIYAYGENKDLSNLSPEEIIKTASSSDSINKTKNLLHETVQNALAHMSSGHTKEGSLYAFAISNLCSLLNIM